MGLNDGNNPQNPNYDPNDPNSPLYGQTLNAPSPATNQTGTASSSLIARNDPTNGAGAFAGQGASSTPPPTSQTPLNAPGPAPATGTQPSPAAPQDPTNGGYGNIPQSFNQIFSGLPQAPNSQIDVNQFSQPSPYEQQLRDAIMSAITSSSAPVSATDPTMAPIISAIQGQAQRAMEQNQQQQGERLYGQGIPASSGGYDSAVTGYNQQMNESTQGNIANTMLSQLNDRQNRLMTALNLGSNYLNADQSRILQAELANVTNAQAQYGMKANTAQGILAQMLNNSQYYSSLGTGANEFAANQNASATTGLGG
jgi:hypothetical protein